MPLGYLILISIDFMILFLRFLLVSIKKINQTLKTMFDRTFPNTLKFVKNTLLCVTFSTLFSVFGKVVNTVFAVCYTLKTVIIVCYEIMEPLHVLSLVDRCV